jgi:hypothetical protein
MKWKWMTIAILMAGCGGGGSSTTSEGEPGTSGDEARREDRDDGAQITGLMGTIGTREVEGALSPRMERFQRCILDRLRAVEFMAGDIRMGFRIHEDGSVAWAYVQESTLGDREAEQCILNQARSARFPRPHGGEAEFSWGFGFDGDEDVRPPASWEHTALEAQLEDASDMARECQASGTYRITAYIARGGRVVSAGGSVPNADGDAALDCLLSNVREWDMPDPGSYAAKVTFQVN